MEEEYRGGNGSLVRSKDMSKTIWVVHDRTGWEKKSQVQTCIHWTDPFYTTLPMVLKEIVKSDSEESGPWKYDRNCVH